MAPRAGGIQGKARSSGPGTSPPQSRVCVGSGRRLISMKGVFTGVRAPLWGPESKVQRCLALTRRGTLCQKPAEVHPSTGPRLRCRLHGGRSGPRTEEGKARIAAANFKHGRYSKAGREQRKLELQARKIEQEIYRTDMAQIRAERTQLENQLREESKQQSKATGPLLVVVPRRPD